MNDWVTKAQSIKLNLSAEDEQTPPPEHEMVILMFGKNTFGERVYSYLKVTYANFLKMKDAAFSNQDFFPSDFGTVLHAGTGEPSAELRSEMAVTYNLVDVKPPPPPKQLNFAQPSVWGDE